MASIRTASTTENLGRKNTSYELDNYGIKEPARVYWNLNTPELYEEIARRNEGVFSNHGAVLVDTGEFTGRAAKDKAIVREAGSEDKVFWGDVNKDFPQEKFNALKERMMAHAKGHHPLLQCIELLLRKVFVDVAPENLIFAARFAHDGFIFRRPARELTGIDQNGAVV